MSTESYLQPCIWQVIHFAWKGFLSAAITFDKHMDDNDSVGGIQRKICSIEYTIYDIFHY